MGPLMINFKMGQIPGQKVSKRIVKRVRIHYNIDSNTLKIASFAAEIRHALNPNRH